MMCGFMSNLGEVEECNDVFAPICPVITARINKVSSSCLSLSLIGTPVLNLAL